MERLQDANVIASLFPYNTAAQGAIGTAENRDLILPSSDFLRLAQCFPGHETSSLAS